MSEGTVLESAEVNLAGKLSTSTVKDDGLSGTRALSHFMEWIYLVVKYSCF